MQDKNILATLLFVHEIIYEAAAHWFTDKCILLHFSQTTGQKVSAQAKKQSGPYKNCNVCVSLMEHDDQILAQNTAAVLY